MKAKKEIFMGVLLAIMVMLPASVMAGDSGRGGEPGAGCPEGDYLYATPAWVGTITLNCVNMDGDGICEEVLFSGTLERLDETGAVDFHNALWTIDLAVEEFNALRPSHLVSLCITDGAIVDVFNTYNIENNLSTYCFVEILGASRITDNDRGTGKKEEVFILEVIMMGLLTRL